MDYYDEKQKRTLEGCAWGWKWIVAITFLVILLNMCACTPMQEAKCTNYHNLVDKETGKDICTCRFY